MRRKQDKRIRNTERKKNQQKSPFQKGFRVLIKNRVTHNNATEVGKSPSHYIEENQKTNQQQLRDFVKNMKRPEVQQLSKTVQFAPKVQQISIKADEQCKEEIQIKAEINLNKQNLKTQENNQMNRSYLSVTSVHNQRECSQSINQSSIPKNNQAINKLKEKLQKSLQNRITKVSKSKLKGYEIDTNLEKQIKQFIECIQEVQDDEGPYQENVDKICTKIQLLERIMASSSIQSDLIRTFYFTNRTQKNNNKHLINQNNSTLYKSANILRSLTQTFKLEKESKISSRWINLQTTNSRSYKKPQKHNKFPISLSSKKYEPNRQPIPRSMYRCQFLQYGSLPMYKFKSENTKLINDKIQRQVDSTYKTDYKQNKDMKFPNRYNYKEMSSYKDKFKTNSISFMNKYNGNKQNCILNNKQQNQIDKQFIRKNKAARGSNSIVFTDNPSFMKNSYQSQANHQFIARKNCSPSIIKHGNFNKLKNYYRNFIVS